ncbi:Fibroblast growth factor receptor [Exaiptasia diaphana]|nr:Fibroblast growth factor receptor [Exaiptasia diaphana]
MSQKIKECVHRDLAARNVLLTENVRAKIADFGLSRDVYERGFYQKTSQGKLPVRWMAIEAIQQMVFTTQSDVWSYGVVLWEIETGGKMPYGGLKMKELLNHLKKGQRLQRPITCKEEIWSYGVVLWEIETGGKMPYGGLKMKELLNHLKKGQRLQRPITCKEEIDFQTI